MNNRKQRLYYGMISVLLIFSAIIWSVCSWYNEIFGVKLEELLFTLASPLEGADTNIVWDAVKICLPIIIVIVTIVGLYIWFDCLIKKKINILLKAVIREKKLEIDLVKLSNIVVAFFSVICFVVAIRYLERSLEIVDYVKQKMSVSKIYEEYYVDPNSVVISGESPKNLLLIYLESMETTYASVEEGGAQDINYIPQLTQMAYDNVSFSDSDKLGGFHCAPGTGWTMAALMATTSGVNYKLPVEGNSMDEYELFAPGLISLGDILEEKEYFQEFLCGSESEFAGRRKYFEQHGNYEMCDYNTAIEEGYIDEDYRVFWGLEDEILYKMAKNELLELSSKDKPFNLTMLTVDTHHVEGYVCGLCDDEYPVQTANVIKCADKQIYNFIEWCKEQTFYKDTVIVITGDHPRMDTSLVENVAYYDRTIYNCIINTDTKIQLSKINREFTPFDILPTTLAAMGYEIEGERLGLGTNLFSDKQTLAEELGFEALSEELNKYSDYYNEKFLQYK